MAAPRPRPFPCCSPAVPPTPPGSPRRPAGRSRIPGCGCARRYIVCARPSPNLRSSTMGFIGLIISWLIIGAIIGLLARAVMPGKQAMGLGMTIVLGVIGAIVGGLIGGLFGGDGIWGIMSNPWSIGTILLAVIGAIVVMVIYGLATKNRA